MDDAVVHVYPLAHLFERRSEAPEGVFQLELDDQVA